MKMLHLVMATNGCYEDRSEWFVAAFEDEDDAKVAVAVIVAWYESHPRLKWDVDDEKDDNAPDGPWGFWKPKSYIRAICPYDPEAVEHNGLVDEPTYSVQSIEVWQLGRFLKRKRPHIV
ncbi:hypothetical protein [Terriglobus sp. RCC_193]|uniref:hypothetical protein n=1 Tax=Terriglobus sp. RCC_193 TaxID=3239218 RepID=UPI003523E3E2